VALMIPYNAPLRFQPPPAYEIIGVMNQNPLNRNSPSDYLRIQRSPEGKALHGECELCGKRFFHSLDQDRAEQQLHEQHREHMFKEHGPFDS